MTDEQINALAKQFQSFEYGFEHNTHYSFDYRAFARALLATTAPLSDEPVAEFTKIVPHEPTKEMLEAALKAELETIERYVRRRGQAETAGEPGLAAQFDTILTDETNHRDELRQMLARWP